MVKIIAPRRDTTASGPQSGNPAWESTLIETLGIRKFIEMSIADIHQQLEAASKDGTPYKLFKAQKQNAFVITAWLTSALMMVDGMLAEAAVKSNTSLAEEKGQEEDGN